MSTPQHPQDPIGESSENDRTDESELRLPDGIDSTRFQKRIVEAFLE